MKVPYNNRRKYIDAARDRTSRFYETFGRRPRILITRLHSKSSDREIKTIATAFADMGFDVDINTSVQSPNRIARLAAENDVHIVAIPGISAANRKFISELIAAFKAAGNENTVLALWAAHHSSKTAIRVPEAKYTKIEIFGSDTEATQGANRILDALEQQG
jgi:methylmalonyl-CoA mutase cobalamin-binding domain/chain